MQSKVEEQERQISALRDALKKRPSGADGSAPKVAPALAQQHAHRTSPPFHFPFSPSPPLPSTSPLSPLPSPPLLFPFLPSPSPPLPSPLSRCTLTFWPSCPSLMLSPRLASLWTSYQRLLSSVTRVQGRPACWKWLQMQESFHGTHVHTHTLTHNFWVLLVQINRGRHCVHGLFSPPPPPPPEVVVR